MIEISQQVLDEMIKGRISTCATEIENAYADAVALADRPIEAQVYLHSYSDEDNPTSVFYRRWRAIAGPCDPTSPHPENQTVLVWHIDQSGRRFVRKYCLKCFTLYGVFIKASSMRPSQLEAMPVVTESLSERLAAGCRDRAQLLSAKSERNRERSKEARQSYEQVYLQKRREYYDAYIRSERWAEKRAMILKRCGHKCEGCGMNPATQVHHLTYEHLGDELLFELVGLCRDCHERVHGIENEEFMR